MVKLRRALAAVGVNGYSQTFDAFLVIAAKLLVFVKLSIKFVG